MKKIVLLLILVFAVIGCDMNYEMQEYSDEEMEVFEYLYADNVDDLYKNVIEKIEYTDDLITWNKREYFQTPYQTAVLKTGDCEDKGLLFMFLLKLYFNIDSEMVGIPAGDHVHAVINILKDDTCNIIEGDSHWIYTYKDVGRIYDTYNASYYPTITNIVEVLDYDELMYYSEKCHIIPFYRYWDGKSRISS